MGHSIAGYTEYLKYAFQNFFNEVLDRIDFFDGNLAAENVTRDYNV